MARELFADSPVFDEMTDMWAFGMVAYVSNLQMILSAAIIHLNASPGVDQLEITIRPQKERSVCHFGHNKWGAPEQARRNW